jgi:hypothetical protein
MNQKKLYPTFSHEFWQDIDRSISFMVRDLITGRDVTRLAQGLRKAGVDKCSDSLIYKWANPENERIPNAKALFLLIKITENCAPLDTLNEACGKVGVPDCDYLEGSRFFMAEFDKRERLRGRK